MRAEIEIGGNLNSGVNGVLLRNCSIASGETAASQNYIQNFRKNRKVEHPSLEGYKILAAFKSRRANSLYFLTDSKKEEEFKVWVLPGINDSPYELYSLEKKERRFSFSYDYGKMKGFQEMDCVLICAFGLLLAFDEINEEKKEISTEPLGGVISGICAFANRMIATVHLEDKYMWNDILKPSFDSSGAGNFAESEYGNDLTQAVRRTGSRLAVFTSKTIEIKDLSSDPDLPFQGYLYQNNYDVGAIVPTILSIGGTLYFVGEEMSGLRSVYSLADGALKKLTTETQSLLLDGSFSGAGISQEGARTFYCMYGGRSFGLDILNGSLFEIDRQDTQVFDYLREGGRILKTTPDGFYMSEAGSDEYVTGRIRLPKYDFGAPASINKLSFIGEFLESSPAAAELTAERGYSRQAAAHRRGFDFFRIGVQRLNDLEFSVNANFRLTKIIADYQLLKNFSYYGG